MKRYLGLIIMTLSLCVTSSKHADAGKDSLTEKSEKITKASRSSSAAENKSPGVLRKKPKTAATSDQDTDKKNRVLSAKTSQEATKKLPASPVLERKKLTHASRTKSEFFQRPEALSAEKRSRSFWNLKKNHPSVESKNPEVAQPETKQHRSSLLELTLANALLEERTRHMPHDLKRMVEGLSSHFRIKNLPQAEGVEELLQLAEFYQLTHSPLSAKELLHITQGRVLPSATKPKALSYNPEDSLDGLILELAQEAGSPIPTRYIQQPIMPAALPNIFNQQPN